MSNTYVEHLLTQIDVLKYDLNEAQLKVEELQVELYKVTEELMSLKEELHMEEIDD